MYGHIGDLDLGGNLPLGHPSGHALQDGLIHRVPPALEAFQVSPDDGAGLGVRGQVGNSGLGVALGLAVVVGNLEVGRGGVLAVLVEDGRDAGAGGVVNDGDQSDRALALSGAALVGGGQLVRIKGSGHAQPSLRNKLVEIMRPVQAKGGNLGELQVMVFGAVADGVAGGAVNATLHHVDLLGLGHVAPAGDALRSVAGGVLSLGLCPRYAEALAHDNLGDLAADFLGGVAADVPGAPHDGGEVVALAGGGVGGGSHSIEPLSIIL